MDEQLFTTGDVAKAWRCSPRSVALLCDRGDLKCFLLPQFRPGAYQHRRIRRKDLVNYMKANKIPMELLPSPDDADNI